MKKCLLIAVLLMMVIGCGSSADVFLKSPLDDRLWTSYGIRVNDAKANSYALDDAHGIVVVTDDLLKEGRIEMTGELSSVANVGKVLISENDGQDWHELPVSSHLSYDFLPLEGIVYRPVLKITMQDFHEFVVPFFSSIEGIVRRSSSLKDLARQSMTDFVKAYEQRDSARLMALTSREYDGLSDRRPLEEALRMDFDVVNNIRMDVAIQKVYTSKEFLVVDITWNKVQTLRTSGAAERSNGGLTMVFVYEEGGMKVRAFKGDVFINNLR
jgi:hypothetical protein